MTGRIDADRLVRQFMDFVRIDSPTFAEAPFLRAARDATGQAIYCR